MEFLNQSDVVLTKYLLSSSEIYISFWNSTENGLLFVNKNQEYHRK